MTEKDVVTTENQELQEENSYEEHDAATDIIPEQPTTDEPGWSQSKDRSAARPSGQEVKTEDAPKARRTRRTKAKAEPAPEDNSVADTETPPVASSPRTNGKPILTIETGTTMETPEQREEMLWHEIRNAHRTRRILQGSLSGIEKTELGTSVAVVYYNDFRVVIPLKEMYLNLNNAENNNYGDFETRQAKIIGNMLGCDIDFIVKGIENKTRTIVASRKDAMLRKRQSFYLNRDSDGTPKIIPGQKIEARVIAVSPKVVRVEAFGVECSIAARDLSWDWLGGASERFSVGDTTLIRVLDITGDSAEDLAIRADVKSVTNNTSLAKLKTCRVQGKYAGTITDIYRGVVFIRLNTGVNAIAHSCYDSRTPGKNDDISFVVTHIDEERSAAVGIITRIIRQNL